MTLSEAARICASGAELPDEAVRLLVRDLLDEKVEDSTKAEFLIALAEKGETPGEIAAFVREIIPYSSRLPFQGEINGKPLIDCCGTGGGGLNLVNISTATMFVLAAQGVPVVKHGNYGMTKKSGSADVLQALGLQVRLSPAQAAQSLEKLSMTFLLAPLYHPAFKAVAPVRKTLGELGKKTIFNLLGPLLNPASPKTQLIGVFHEKHLELFHRSLMLIGVENHLVAYGTDENGNPIGELSANGKSIIRGTIKGQSIYRPLLPGGLLEAEGKGKISDLLISHPNKSAERILAVFKKEEKGLLLATLCRNAGACFYVQGKSASFEDGICLAFETIKSGKALAKLREAQAFQPN